MHFLMTNDVETISLELNRPADFIEKKRKNAMRIAFLMLFKEWCAPIFDRNRTNQRFKYQNSIMLSDRVLKKKKGTIVWYGLQYFLMENKYLREKKIVNKIPMSYFMCRFGGDM